MDHIGHGVIDALGIAGRHQTEFVHESHQLRRVGFRLRIPDRGGVTAGLIGPVQNRGNGGGGHGFQFLHGHRTGGILRADNIHLHQRVGARMQHGAVRDADGVVVEDFFNGGKALTGMGNDPGRRKNRFRFNA